MTVYECAICRDELCTHGTGGTVEALDCGHVFHSKCIARWFVRKETCPTCRTPVRSEPRTRLFFTLGAANDNECDDNAAAAAAAGGGGGGRADGNASNVATTGRGSDNETPASMLKMYAAEKTSLLRQLREAREDEALARDELDGMRAECEELTTELDGARRSTRELERELGRSRNALREVEAARKILENERRDLSQRLRTSRAEIAHHKVQTDTTLDEEALKRMSQGRDLQKVIANAMKTIAMRNKSYRDLIDTLEGVKKEMSECSREKEKHEERARKLTVDVQELQRVCNAQKETIEARANTHGPTTSGHAWSTAPPDATIEVDEEEDADDLLFVGRDAMDGVGVDANAATTARRRRQGRSHKSFDAHNEKGNVCASKENRKPGHRKSTVKRVRSGDAAMPEPEFADGFRVRSDSRLRNAAAATSSFQNGSHKDPVRSVGTRTVLLEGPDGRGGYTKVYVDKGTARARLTPASTTTGGSGMHMFRDIGNRGRDGGSDERATKRKEKMTHHTLASPGLTIQHFFS